MTHDDSTEKHFECNALPYRVVADPADNTIRIAQEVANEPTDVVAIDAEQVDGLMRRLSMARSALAGATKNDGGE